RCPPTSTLFPYTTLFRSCTSTIPIRASPPPRARRWTFSNGTDVTFAHDDDRHHRRDDDRGRDDHAHEAPLDLLLVRAGERESHRDRKSTRLNSSHVSISY